MDIALDGDVIWHDDDSTGPSSVSVEDIMKGDFAGRDIVRPIHKPLP
jgi:hypothetical protein